MHFLYRVFVFLFIVAWVPLADGQSAAPPKTLQEALTTEFKCPSESHDSGRGPSPGVIVRWCEIGGGGRPLYHGPVWRWYRNGQLEGKEYYVNGNAAGVWPSYYENGHFSSLGEFADGKKHGLWRYWDEEGQLTTEVTYLRDGSSRTDYYSSGKKKAVGVFTRTGKIGKWTYWEENGEVKAECDFGQGVFTTQGRGCQLIAAELDPKGFSPPIPTSSVSRESATIHVGPQVFQFSLPKSWVADSSAGRDEDAPLVFYREGKKWRAPGVNMYVRVIFRRDRTFEQTISDESDEFEENVSDYQERTREDSLLPTGKAFRLNSVTYKPLIATDSPFSIVGPNQIHEEIAYVDSSNQVMLMLVLTADTDEQLQGSKLAFQTILESFQ